MPRGLPNLRFFRHSGGIQGIQARLVKNLGKNIFISGGEKLVKI
jgi:hypothetical protein